MTKTTKTVNGAGETADQAHARLCVDVSVLLNAIADSLQTRECASGWGAVGDMAHVKGLLSEVEGFMSGTLP